MPRNPRHYMLTVICTKCSLHGSKESNNISKPEIHSIVKGNLNLIEIYYFSLGPRFAFFPVQHPHTTLACENPTSVLENGPIIVDPGW